MTAKEIIEQQQQGKEGTAAWMVGEQLKDILRGCPGFDDMIAKDLTGEGMTIDDAEKKIAEYAKNHKKNGCGVCPPNEAERIIREFYGLPGAGKAETPGVVKLADIW